MVELTTSAERAAQARLRAKARLALVEGSIEDIVVLVAAIIETLGLENLASKPKDQDSA